MESNLRKTIEKDIYDFVGKLVFSSNPKESIIGFLNNKKNMEEFNPEKQLEIINLSQLIFSNKDKKEALTSEEYELLRKAFYDNTKKKSKIKGML